MARQEAEKKNVERLQQDLPSRTENPEKKSKNMVVQKIIHKKPLPGHSLTKPPSRKRHHRHMRLMLIIRPTQHHLLLPRAQPLRIRMPRIIPKRRRHRRIDQQHGRAVGPYDHSARRILDVHLGGVGGERDDEPVVVEVGVEDVAAAVLGAAHGFGDCDGGGGGGGPA